MMVGGLVDFAESLSELEPVMLIRMPRAPSMAPASSSGEAMAAMAASTLRGWLRSERRCP